MHKKEAFVIFFLLFVAGLPVFAGAADREGEPTGDGGVAVQGETPKPLLRVEVKNGRLSVELVDAGFGEVMNAIAEQTGMKVEIIGAVYTKTVTTAFADLDLERGIARLLSLVKEKNYMIRYDAKGMVSKVEVYSPGATPVGKAVQTQPRTLPSSEASSRPSATSSVRRAPTVRKNPPVSKRILSPLRETDADSASKETRMDNRGETGSEGYEEELPAEPAENIPAYIPPRQQE